MMLRLVETEKLRTKKIVFEDVFLAQDAYTLEQLRDLSSKRKAVEDILNRNSASASSPARRASGVCISQIEQDIEKLEHYMPLLDDLIAYQDVNKEHPQMIKWVRGLKIRWASSLNSSNFLTQIGGGLKFYQLDDLLFERYMVLFLYSSTLQRLGLELKSTDLVQSVTFLRKAAGVYSYLACEVSISFEKAVKVEKPSELSRSALTALSLICLAEAQAATVQRAEEKKTSVSLLAKLHRGVTLFLNEAMHALYTDGHKDISKRFMDFIWHNKALHEFRSQIHLAEQFKGEEKLGITIGIFRTASANLMKNMPTNESWRATFTQEITCTSEILRKLEREYDFVWHGKVCAGSDLPLPEGKKIVEAIQFEPKPPLKKQLLFDFCGGKLVKSKSSSKGKSSH